MSSASGGQSQNPPQAAPQAAPEAAAQAEAQNPPEAAPPSRRPDQSDGQPLRPARRVRHRLRLRWPRFLPRTFQGRLSLAFVLAFAVAIGISSVLTVYVVDRELRRQDQTTLEAHANALAEVVRARADGTAASDPVDQTVVSAAGVLNPRVRLDVETSIRDWANQVALADVQIRFGLGTVTSRGTIFLPADDLSSFTARLTIPPGRGQARDSLSYTETFPFPDEAGVRPTWYLEVTVSSPYTSRASTIAVVYGFLALSFMGALVLAVLAAWLLARRLTAPLRRLTDAARALAEGNLDKRVPLDRRGTGAAEISELSRQFNTMADQVQETMAVIVRDRDRSRDFLADVSHELRTPLAALRTFNELLQEKAGSDPAARAEFLESSAQQLERLDWLAQNLLELSKLDSGLVRLDLRPDDLRATVQSAVEQAEAAARRRGVTLRTELPDAALVVRHDPPRVGQIVSNLVGNALKFTPRGGTVSVKLTPHRIGARIQVADTGVGIDPSELPHIFDRFFRGSRANEARSSGSGLGLAIVRSIVEMHGGRIAVESRVGPGSGSTFTITLPFDPRTPAEKAAAAAAEKSARLAAEKARKADTSRRAARIRLRRSAESAAVSTISETATNPSTASSGAAAPPTPDRDAPPTP